LGTQKEPQQSRKYLKQPANRHKPRILYPPDLPIVARRDDITAVIKKHPVVVITGETGSGKTTQIPKFCIEAGRGQAGMIACTQPRRIAAIAVARRIAEEMEEEVGRSVGYKIRFDDHTPPGAVVKVMTDGILLMEAHTDPLLRRYDTVIVDEAHERSLNIDFVLGILNNIRKVRDDLRIVITSATIDADKFSEAFGGAPVIEVSGRMYPVEIRYAPPAPDADEMNERNYIDGALRAVDELVRKKERGDILVFMPTEEDIRETCELLTGHHGENAVILPLFSRLSRLDQQRVFQSAAVRRIVVATNIAETSLTIPGIRFVIDAGLARMATYNPRSRTAGLPVLPISRSSADQRKGRCGRVESGVCIRLYSEEEYLAKPLYTLPEILRANLAGVILRMLFLGLGEIHSFPFIDKPAPKSIKDGLETLREIKAIEPGQDDSGQPWKLTKMGKMMARLPIDPRIARIIVEARKEGCLQEALVIASALALQDPRERPVGREKDAERLHASFKDPASDFITLLNIYNFVYGAERSQGRIRKLCRDNLLSYRRMREWREIRNQLAMILAENRFIQPSLDEKGENTMSSGESPTKKPQSGADYYAAIHRSILSGFLGHIAVKKDKNIYTATHGREAMIFPGSGLFKSGGNWIVSAELIETSRLFARTAATIESGWIEELAGALCRHSYFAPHWEKKRGEVVASEQVTLFGLVIVSGRNVSYGKIDPVEASRIFIRSALIEGELNAPLPFHTRNAALIKKISDMEEKIRRRSLLVDEEKIFRFYEEKLPGICDIRTLQRLIRDRGSDSFLHMNEEDLLENEPNPSELELYPDSVSMAGWKLECKYAFTPGKPEDGITLKIPVQATRSAPAPFLDWAVPGLLREKIEALLRSLPKEYRKRMMPLANSVDIIMREMPREGRLSTALSRFVRERLGVDAPADAWNSVTLEERLKLRFSIVDGSGRELAAGRDISILEQGFSDPEGEKIIARARLKWEKTNIKSWNFGDIPESVAVDGRENAPLILYPALESAGESVSLRLFKTAHEAALSHKSGVMALFCMHFQKELKSMRKSLAASGELKLHAAAFGGAKALENALYEKTVHTLFAVDIRRQTDFFSHAENSRSQIVPAGQKIVKMAAPVIKALYEVFERFRKIETANRTNRPLLAFLGELRDETFRLAPPDFLLKYDEKRLPHIVRYLRSIMIRAERGAVHLEKALLRGKEIHEIESLFNELFHSSQTCAEEKRILLEELRWMIEEYKVSVFAQELKTPFPVSRKRLDSLIENIRRIV
jgi:ATP-dependent helicase HrpA